MFFVECSTNYNKCGSTEKFIEKFQKRNKQTNTYHVTTYNTHTQTKMTKSEEPQKFLKTGKVVIILQGRYAGRKAVIVKNFDEPTEDKPFPHAIVAGIDKYPKAVSKRMSKKKITMRSHVKPFIRVYNYQHLMPTRYGVDIDLKGFVGKKALADPTQKKAAVLKIKKKFELRYIQGKNKWFFSKLKF